MNDASPEYDHFTGRRKPKPESEVEKREVTPAPPELCGEVSLEYVLNNVPCVVNWRMHSGLVGAAVSVIARKMGEVDHHGMPTRAAAELSNKVLDRAYGLPKQQVHHTANGVDLNAMMTRVEQQQKPNGVLPAPDLNDILRIDRPTEPPPNGSGTAKPS